jgi:hypothetical protein
MGKITDFDDLAKKLRKKIKVQIKDKTGEPVYEDIDKVWDEISFVKPAETEVERSNRTYIFEKDKIRLRIIKIREKLQSMYDFQYPIERRVINERLFFLEKEYYKFDYMINPYHLQPGLILDLDITSIKRKKATLDGMANVLNEFLHGVSKGFQDAAFASFSRRRSTVREDIGQSFSSSGDDEKASSPGNAYLDMINSGESESAAAPKAPAKAAAPKAIEAPKRGRKPGQKAGLLGKAGGKRRGRPRTK